MTNDRLIALNDLKGIAARMRERQEVIEAGKTKTMAQIADVISAIADQGRDILLAKTKLGKHLKWSEWLGAHIPNLSESVAARYERVTTEQLSDPRQCIFAFLPPADREQSPERIPPAAWEMASGYINKLAIKFRDQPLDTWPGEQVDATRKQLEPLVRSLWPERFV